LASNDLSAAPAQALPDEIFKYVDIVSPNETELELLSGKSINSADDAKEAAKVLLAKSVIFSLNLASFSILFNTEVPNKFLSH